VREPGYYTAFWDGCDAQGRRAPAGVYFITFDVRGTDSYSTTEKAILMK
jgi:hypothetical protein